MKTMKKYVLCCALSAFNCIAFAQSTCDQFSKAIDDSMKYMALLEAMGSGKNDAGINTQQLIQTSLIQTNIFLMKENKCPLPKYPIDSSAYSKNAYACTGAFLNLTRGAGVPPECNRGSWTRTER